MYEFACIEGDRPWFMEIVRHGGQMTAKFEAAILAQDWPTCAVESHMDDSHNSGLRPRNVATRTLFWNAAMRRDPDVLWYPRDLTSEPPDVA